MTINPKNYQKRVVVNRWCGKLLCSLAPLLYHKDTIKHVYRVTTVVTLSKLSVARRDRRRAPWSRLAAVTCLSLTRLLVTHCCGCRLRALCVTGWPLWTASCRPPWWPAGQRRRPRTRIGPSSNCSNWRRPRPYQTCSRRGIIITATGPRPINKPLRRPRVQTPNPTAVWPIPDGRLSPAWAALFSHLSAR